MKQTTGTQGGYVAPGRVTEPAGDEFAAFGITSIPGARVTAVCTPLVTQGAPAIMTRPAPCEE